MTAVWAHRGSAAHAVENTLAAFAEARALGADGVELDVHLSADGALVVHHDAEIPGAGPIAALGVGDLPAHVPLLGDALAACEGMVVNVELKAPEAEPVSGEPPGSAAHDGTAAHALVTATVALLDDLGCSDRVVVSSFDEGLLADVHSADPGLVLGLLLGWGANPHNGLARALAAGFAALHPFVGGVDAALVDAAHAAGLAVHVWTVNAPDDVRRLRALGVEALITDRVAEARAALAEGDR